MINITFNNFNIELQNADAQQYDNLTVPISFIGQFPDEYTTWTMYLAHGAYLDVINLIPTEGGYTYPLKASELALGGVYQIQIYGQQGNDEDAPVKHSNVIAVKVPSSLSGNAHWVEIPTAFTDLKNEMQAIADSITGLTADATVDANAGTPSVTVTPSMVDDKIHLDFDFKNLKGDQGKPGPAGSNDWDEITNKPTTISGYGITDAYTKEQSDSKYAPVIVSTASGNPATFTDGADNLPIQSLVAELLATQSGSGDPTPTNIRPILAVSECNVTANADTHTFDLSSAGTIYGGKLDITTGLLTITHTIYNLGAGNWSYNSSRAYFGRSFGNIKQTPSGAVPSMLCEGYKVGQTRQGPNWLNVDDFTIGQLSNDTVVVIKDSRYTNATDFKAAVNGIHVVFELDSPSATYQLTPTEVKTLLGNNSIGADTGSVTVNYIADTKKYIDDRVNAIMTIIANL